MLLSEMQAGSIPQRGKSDNDVINTMQKYGIPVTRENYLNLAYFGNPPAELSAEEELELPEEIRSNANLS